jgi:hypothetical protein
MEKRIFKPGFEFIFSLSILAVLGLPPLVSAQAQTKDLQININNGDTTINGKNIKDLTVAERKDALKNINQIATINVNDQNGTRNMVIVTRKHKGDKGDNDVVIEQNGNNDMLANGDTKVRRLELRRDNKNDSTLTLSYDYNMTGAPKHRIEMRELHINRDDDRPMGFGRKNTQNFMYTNTDNDGISTHVSYRVSDHPATLDYDAGKAEKSQLDMLNITDLTLVPEFSAGKTVLTFGLPSKAAAEVQFKDSKGNLLWSEKALNGKFDKSFALGLNGVYYLQVKQGNKVAVKEIMKD